MIQSIRAKIADYRRENGTRQLIGRCLIKLKNTLFFYQKEVIGCISLLDQILDAHPKISVNVRAAEISDIPELKILTSCYKKRNFLQWINDNYIFYVAQIKNPAEDCGTSSTTIIPEQPPANAQITGGNKRIVGYVCVCQATKYNHKLVSVLKLKDTDYWAIDSYIHPEYRGKGINPAIASGFLAQAKSDGYKRGYGTILFNNNASRKSYAIIGEREIGVFTTVTIMGCTFYFLKKNKEYEEYFI
jgi:RimJ/RimL family protein N-acetyltransferase